MPFHDSTVPESRMAAGQRHGFGARHAAQE
jgi:hypothetical protein